jgi:hypothetical protein
MCRAVQPAARLMGVVRGYVPIDRPRRSARPDPTCFPWFVAGLARTEQVPCIRTVRRDEGRPPRCEGPSSGRGRYRCPLGRAAMRRIAGATLRKATHCIPSLPRPADGGDLFPQPVSRKAANLRKILAQVPHASTAARQACGEVRAGGREPGRSDAERVVRPRRLGFGMSSLTRAVPALPPLPAGATRLITCRKWRGDRAGERTLPGRRSCSLASRFYVVTDRLLAARCSSRVVLDGGRVRS